MKKMLLLLLACATLLFSCAPEDQSRQKPLESGTAGPGDSGYSHKITIENMQFNWRVDGQNLAVLLRAGTMGWLGAGFNPTQGMKDASFIIGAVQDGRATITAQHGTDPKQHLKDTDLGGQDNLAGAGGKQENNQTEIRFSIPLKSPDRLDPPIDPSGETVVLLSYGPGAELAQQHVFWARLRVNLTDGNYSVDLKKKQ